MVWALADWLPCRPIGKLKRWVLSQMIVVEVRYSIRTLLRELRKNATPRIRSQKLFSISTRRSDQLLFQRMQDRCEYLARRAPARAPRRLAKAWAISSGP